MGATPQAGEGGLAAQPVGVLAGGDEQLAGMVLADRRSQSWRSHRVDLGLEQVHAAGDRLQRCLAGIQRVGQTSSSGRNLAQVAINADVERSLSASRTGAGAVTTSALS